MNVASRLTTEREYILNAKYIDNIARKTILNVAIK